MSTCGFLVREHNILGTAKLSRKVHLVEMLTLIDCPFFVTFNTLFSSAFGTDYPSPGCCVLFVTPDWALYLSNFNFEEVTHIEQTSNPWFGRLVKRARIQREVGIRAARDKSASHWRALRGKGVKNMLGIIAAVLIVLWLLGFLAFHVSSGVIHVLLIIGIVMLLAHFFRGRTATS